MQQWSNRTWDWNTSNTDNSQLNCAVTDHPTHMNKTTRQLYMSYCNIYTAPINCTVAQWC